MRRGFLGSIAALAAGAGLAGGQAPMPAAPGGGPPAAIAPAGDIIQAQGPAPVIMPPVTVGPPGDPLGMGPTAGLGPPPGPMWPPPGAYAAPQFQPPPPGTGGAGGGGSGYGTAPRFWFEGNYMLGFVTPQPIGFPLLTTSAPNQNGVLGQSTTIALIPAQNIDYGAVSGFRLGGGFYGDADRRFGFDMSAFSLGERRYHTSVGTDTVGGVGIPVLARPYIDATTGAQTSLVLISPTIAATPLDLSGTGTGTGTDPDNPPTVRGTGRVRFNTSTQAWGIDPNALWNVFRSSPGQKLWMSLDVMAGYRYLEVEELLRITSSTQLFGVTATPIFTTGPFGVPVQSGIQIAPTPVSIGGVTTAGTPTSPTNLNITDRFVAINSFNGGNFGFRSEIRYGMLTLTTVGKVAVGNMHQQLRVRGLTTFSNAFLTNQNNTLPVLTGYSYGGLYANASNIGTFSRDDFSVIPELNVNLSINLTKSVTMFLGYNMIYIDDVIRPGSQLNPNINPALVPFGNTYGTAGPAPSGPPVFVQKEYWIHAVNFGFQFKF